MEQGQLRALRELGDRGSIAAVALALRVTPSSVSQQISALQRRSSVPLTVKDGRRLTLTDAGRVLARAAIDVEVAFERAEQAVARFQSEPAGTVTVAAFNSAALSIFGPLIIGLSGPDQPRVGLSDQDVAQEGFPSLTADHDLVIAHRLVGSAPWPATVRVEPLLFEPLDLVVRRDHRLAAMETIEPADLDGEAWVAVHEGFPLESAIAAIAGIGGRDARILHRINEFFVAARVVEASGCIALMPRYTSDLRHHPDLVLRPLSPSGLGRHIDCLARPETLERAAVRTVLERLRTIASGLAEA
ncbi:LysR family transcriptional regulator [Frondihabitans sp. PAMC 28766]|uniref:LysR family transcriptional regulator n=1 Tax=Frondihabitans sp. PAMC 28766 TaxID=1795630 RepID=UPI00078E6F39|nr:LysR family transcriptional regulator [Frondihabitans sp. PAMC 28766]AMM22042.1 LysR family transcriptional regulator [Frondihabitans sp. PAMC 28766]